MDHATAYEHTQYRPCPTGTARHSPMAAFTPPRGCSRSGRPDEVLLEGPESLRQRDVIDVRMEQAFHPRNQAWVIDRTALAQFFQVNAPIPAPSSAPGIEHEVLDLGHVVRVEHAPRPGGWTSDACGIRLAPSSGSGAGRWPFQKCMCRVGGESRSCPWGAMGSFPRSLSQNLPPRSRRQPLLPGMMRGISTLKR